MLPELDVVRLRHMLDAASEAMQFVEGRARGDLDSDKMLNRAVIRDIEIIGEAAGRVSGGTQAQLGSIPWPGIIGMRNRLIHGYFDVDTDRLWDTLTDDLPALAAELRRILRSR
jgi:uncharacterized protein with HEPN domain